MDKVHTKSGQRKKVLSPLLVVPLVPMADLVARIDEQLAIVAASTGFPLDQVRYVLWFAHLHLAARLTPEACC